MMNKLSAFEFNNTQKLFELAKKLNKSKFFQSFLNEAQYKILSYLIELDNFTIWYNFLEGNCSVKFLNDVNEENKDTEDAEKEESIENEDTSETKEKTEDDEKDQDNAEPKESQEENHKPEKPEPKINDLRFEEGPKMIKMLALHIRYLLWEKAIDFYYNSKDLDDSTNNFDEISDDFELIDSLDKSDGDIVTTDQEKIEPEKPVVRQEEDDYDDDDDEEEEKEKENSTNADVSDKNDGEPTTEVNDENQVILEVPLSLLKQREIEQDLNTSMAMSAPPESEKNETPSLTGDSFKDQTPIPPSSSQPVEDQENLIREFNKVYHNFEYDRETLIKRRKLEKSDLKLKKIDESKNQETSQNGDSGDSNGTDSNSSSNIGINIGSGSTSLQHLLSTIQQKRDNVPLNDFELRTLFMDVRKNRGKWANDDRVGQEELYEACEKVILELRGYTEHSTPFLNKVSKREAPNYGLIIKKPMDLNTVMKKLKALSYNSKQEFIDDVNLIWSNCLTYNADPKHFIRSHAIAMQEKTAKLAATIPNITIRNRADIEMEEEETEQRPATPLSGGAGKGVKKGRKRTRQDQVKTEIETDSPISRAASVVASPETKVTASETPAVENGSVSVEEEEEEEGEEEEADNEEPNSILEDEEEEFDPELQAWRSITAKSRANYCAQRSELFDENSHLRFDANAILRLPGHMRDFNRYLDNKEVISKNTNLLESTEPYLLEYDIAGGIPGFKYKGIDKEQEEKREEKLVDIYLQQVNGDASKIKSGFVLPTTSGLNKIYFENIAEIQEIKKICFKISLIRQMQTQQFVHHTQMKQPEIETLREVDVDSTSKLPNHDIHDEDVQFAVLRRNVAKIAMQTGFETTQPTAINSLAQIAERYMGNLAKSLKLHTESTSANKLSTREIVLLSLLENGVDKPDDLYTYVQEKVIKQQDKLKDLRSKLANFLKDLLRPGLENFNERSFEDNSEQFMTGDFSNDIGDDFFGFKQLGLDKEFKMLSTSIPIYLLHSRLHNSYSNTGNSSKRNKYEDLDAYVNVDLVANKIDQQIGLLKPFYNKLYEKSKAHFIKMQKKKGESTELPENNSLVLIEDEELPQKQRNIRPRLPPTGKISGVKKKIIANAFFLPDEVDEQEAGDNLTIGTSNDYVKREVSDKSKPVTKSPKKSQVKLES